MENKSQIKGIGHNPITVTIITDCHRKLTDAEEDLIGQCTGKIYDLIHLTNWTTTPEHIEEYNRQIADLIACFGEYPIYVEDVINPYWPLGQYPALQVTTPIGRMRIHWRKRVIEINWGDSINKRSADHLFPDVLSTKGDHMIHADTYDDATEYISKIIQSQLNS